MLTIQIEWNKDSIVESSTHLIKNTIRFLYKWLTSEGEALGYILGHIHFTLFVCLLLLVVVSHTIYPNVWLQFFVVCIIFLIWLQHVFLKVCISIIAEKDFTNHISPFHHILETVFGVSIHDFTNYFIVAETVALLCFSLELISRCIIQIQASNIA